MKIKGHDYDCLSHALKCVYEELGGESFADKYRNGDFPHADKCKDINMRFRWDILWSIPLDIRGPLINRIYLYANDDHIDTVLRRVIPDIVTKKDV